MFKSLFIFVFLYSSAEAQQTAAVTEVSRWQAKIVEEVIPEGKSITFLKWNKDSILVESTSFLHYTDIQGRFDQKVTQATLNSKQIPLKDDGSFDVHFGFPGESKVFTITAIDANNRIYRSKYRIVPIDHQEVVLEKMTPNRWRFSAGAGVTTLSFRQRNVVPFSQQAVTVKGSAAFKITPEKLELGLSGFYNLVPFGTTSPVGYKIQYLGVNGRLSWNLLGAPSPIRINLSAGAYYNTSVSRIGFANMYGPQFYPEFVFVFNNGNSLIFYGKYSPALSQGNIVDFAKNREVASGAHYSFPITFRNRMSIGVDLSQLNLSVKSGDWASTNTYSLSAGISF